jgi:hypothetical protein
MLKNKLQQDRPEKIIWRMRIARCIPRATNTQSEHVVLIAFYGNNGCMNATECYVTRALSVVCLLESVHWLFDPGGGA